MYFLYVTNQHYYGHLLNLDNFHEHLTTTQIPEFYQLFDNQIEWERIYVHENYTRHVLNDSVSVAMPCPDVYTFPLVSERYCADLLAIANAHEQNSSASFSDQNASATNDVHLSHSGFEKQWIFFLREYVRPMQLRLYEGYNHNVRRKAFKAQLRAFFPKELCNT